jgi:hypothetical protein
VEDLLRGQARLARGADIETQPVGYREGVVQVAQVDGDLRAIG